jgi:hypothetical protein
MDKNNGFKDYTSSGTVLCIARQGIHINRKDRQARFIARRSFISYL